MINAIAIDNMGNKWFGTDYGVYEYDNSQWIWYSTSNSGLINDYVFSVAIDLQGNKWFGTRGGISKLDTAKWSNYINPEGGNKNHIHALSVDDKGHIWIGSDGGGLSEFDGTSFTDFTGSNGLIDDRVYSIAIDAQNNKWIGTYTGVSRFDGANWTSYTMNEGLSQPNVVAAAVDSNDNKWFGFGNNIGSTTEFDDTRWTTFTPENSGLADCQVYSIAVDAKGNTWFGTNYGISVFERQVLTVSTQLITMEETDGTGAFDIISNTPWTLTSEQNWLSADREEGTGNGTITVTADANTFSISRNASVTVSGTGVKPQVVSVLQKGGTTGIADITGTDYEIYPNPANTFLNLGFSTDGTVVTVVDLRGNTVMYQPVIDHRIDISTLPNGIYVIRLADPSGIILRKFMKQ